MAALILVVVLGFTALVIDIGQIILAKQECQNAADSGALAGARHLVPYLTSTPPIPDWYNAQTVATEAVTSNRSNHILLTDCNVQAGYWNLVNKVLQSTSIVPTLLDVPAVRVNVARAPEQNTGPVLMTFARIFGINIANVSAQGDAPMPRFSSEKQPVPHCHCRGAIKSTLVQ